eukprot:TRINITY_DN513_c16_g1_i1.p1 TRINITY_DN513_c16_g1~~TRINITY_DN513_c16_g1_i1.p1  ORF type:complete len:465 (+),score=98.69 TRINITY_DN513_c16_g1_i1:37-1431(+)
MRTLTMLAVVATAVAVDMPSISEAKKMHKKKMSEARLKASSNGHVFKRRFEDDPSAVRGRMLGDYTNGAVFSPTDFGADPTGKTDSTDAVTKALNSMLSVANASSMADGIRNLGGATLDLRGGTYLISKSLVVPQYFGNFKISDGTLMAASNFSSPGYLVHVGGSVCTNKQRSCNEEIVFDGVMFNSNHKASGGLYIGATMGAVVIESFFYGFNSFGIKIDGGHETMVSNCWLSEYYYSETSHPPGNSIGIHVNGNDHYITNVIVFDYTTIGILVSGAANLLTGIHTWNGGGVGIQLGNTSNAYGATKNRLTGCYLDYNTLDVYNPVDTIIENGFFLQTHMNLIGGHSNGLVMEMNTFVPNPKQGTSIVLEGDYTPESVQTTSITGNNCKVSIHRFTEVVTGQSLVKDLSKILLFPFIKYVQYSVLSDSPPSDSSAFVQVNGTQLIMNRGASQFNVTFNVEVRQ